jgi:hypothetical protein
MFYYGLISQGGELMRITRAFSQGSSGAGTNSKGISGLKKSELTADIFNHKLAKEGGTGDVKLHLSYAVKALTEEFKGKIKSFLHENQDFAKSLDDIKLPETIGETRQGADLSLRRLRAYVSWMKIRESSLQTDISPSEASYYELQQTGKDTLVKELIQEHEDQRLQLKEQRKKLMPNYYYAVNPETYSFN